MTTIQPAPPPDERYPSRDRKSWEHRRDTGDALLNALMSKIPSPDTVWSIHTRAEWLRCMEMAFRLIYQGGDDGTRIEIRATVEKPGLYTDGYYARRIADGDRDPSTAEGPASNPSPQAKE